MLERISKNPGIEIAKTREINGSDVVTIRISKAMGNPLLILFEDPQSLEQLRQAIVEWQASQRRSEYRKRVSSEITDLDPLKFKAALDDSQINDLFPAQET